MDDLITIKEYAAARGITYQAANATIKRHIKELKPHIRTIDRVRYIDNTAVSVLDSYRAAKPQITSKDSKADLKAQIDALTAKLIERDEAIIMLQGQLRAAENKAALLLTDNTTLKAQLPFWRKWRLKRKADTDTARTQGEG